MVKKIRFPLEMEYGIEVRNMEELKANFSLARILLYVSNGKLVNWLRDRYIDDIADEIEKLSINDSDLAEKVCNIFKIPYDEQIIVDMKKIDERNQKLCILKDYTTEQLFLNNIDNVAFTQDELYDLLDLGTNTIYLFGDKYSIPVNKDGITYIGINNPIVVIDSEEESFRDKNITLIDVSYDEKYQSVINGTEHVNTYRNEDTNADINFYLKEGTLYHNEIEVCENVLVYKLFENNVYFFHYRMIDGYHSALLLSKYSNDREVEELLCTDEFWSVRDVHIYNNSIYFINSDSLGEFSRFDLNTHKLESINFLGKHFMPTAYNLVLSNSKFYVLSPHEKSAFTEKNLYLYDEKNIPDEKCILIDTDVKFLVQDSNYVYWIAHNYKEKSYIKKVSKTNSDNVFVFHFPENLSYVADIYVNNESIVLLFQPDRFPRVGGLYILKTDEMVLKNLDVDFNDLYYDDNLEVKGDWVFYGRNDYSIKEIGAENARLFISEYETRGKSFRYKIRLNGSDKTEIDLSSSIEYYPSGGEIYSKYLEGTLVNVKY